MKKIDIAINQAKLLSYRVTLKDDEPEIYANIGLYAGNKKISDFSIDSHSYYDEQKFDIPVKMIPPIMKIAKELEIITALHCSSAIGQLTEGK